MVTLYDLILRGYPLYCNKVFLRIGWYMVAIMVINNCRCLGQEFALLNHCGLINHNSDSSFLFNATQGIVLIALHFHITVR